MIKKALIASLLSVFSVPCFSSFYLGLSVGPEGGLFKQTAHIAQIGTFNVTDRNHFAGTGVFGSIFGGYGYTFNRFYLAVEGNANLSTLEYDSVNNDYTHLQFTKTYFRIHENEGASLLPGFFLAPNSLLYGRIAYANGRLKIVEGDPSIQNVNTTRSGIRYGIGLRQAIKPRLSFMLDYSQTNYRHIKSLVSFPNILVTKYTKITPNSAQLGIGLVYNFDGPARWVDEK